MGRFGARVWGVSGDFGAFLGRLRVSVGTPEPFWGAILANRKSHRRTISFSRFWASWGSSSGAPGCYLRASWSIPEASWADMASQRFTLKLSWILLRIMGCPRAILDSLRGLRSVSLRFVNIGRGGPAGPPPWVVFL